MKMIASTKLVRAQREMNRARVYGKSAQSVIEVMGAKQTAEGGKILIVAVSSDKGLCGGIHSTISRGIRPVALANPNVELITIGDKVKAQLARLFSSRIIGSFNQVGSKPVTFTDACLITDVVLQNSDKFDTVRLAHNGFRSAIAYVLEFINIPSSKAFIASDKLAVYEVEDDVLKSLHEFTVANALYAAMSDGYAAEIAAKMTAMDNATRNAGDLISKLTIVYNRTRQAAITVELIDIITGASAL